ncbi:MAG TPA: hypothetical protein VFF77_00730 [Holophagaceae bacterium]|nr:hypothetical protein [Holophagaceae bacterium]
MRAYLRIPLELAILLAIEGGAFWGWKRLTRPQPPYLSAAALDQWPARTISDRVPGKARPLGIEAISFRADHRWTVRLKPKSPWLLGEVDDESGSKLFDFGFVFIPFGLGLDYQIPGADRETWEAPKSGDRVVGITRPGWRLSREIWIKMPGGRFSPYICASYEGLGASQARLADAAISSMTFANAYRRWVRLQDLLGYFADSGREHLDWDEAQGTISAFGEPIAKVDGGSIVKVRLTAIPSDDRLMGLPPGGPEWFDCSVVDWDHLTGAGPWLGWAWEQARDAALKRTGKRRRP